MTRRMGGLQANSTELLYKRLTVQYLALMIHLDSRLFGRLPRRCHDSRALDDVYCLLHELADRRGRFESSDMR